MSELKAFTFCLGQYANGSPCVVAVDDEENPRLASDEKFYLKSEADKVIAELKDKLKVQTSNAEEAWKLKDVYHTSYAESVKELYEKNKKLRHQKFKRCLDKAELCHWKMGVFIYHKKKNDFYYRWHKRWLELAEKFKEAK